MTTPEQEQIIEEVLLQMERETMHDLIFQIGRCQIRQAMERAVERCCPGAAQEVKA